MFKKRQLLDIFLVLVVSTCVFLGCISQESVGLWEPWETSTILTARQMAQSRIVEASFWVPELNDMLVSKPYMQLWPLALILHLYPDPDAFLLRLPAACIGIFLTLLTFCAIRFAVSRRAAWITSLVLLTLPMFVLGGKLIHGGIWLVFAIALPNLFYLLASYAPTRRMHRVMVSMTGLSIGLSFLSGGLFALAVLVIETLFFFLLMRKHPHRSYAFKSLTTRFFLFPLYITFLFNVLIFGLYTTNVRYSLEHRVPMTLSEINDALDEDRVISIERRQNQIIGTYRYNAALPPYREEQRPFVLVQSSDGWNTNATAIFESNDSERRTFENFLMWRFQKQTPARSAQDAPTFDGALPAALRFFWYNSNTDNNVQTLSLARVNRDALDANPELAGIHSTNVVSSSISEVLALDGVSFETQQKLEPDALVRVLGNEESSEWVEIETGGGVQGFVRRDALDVVSGVSTLNLTSWLDVLLYGMMPWIWFFPVMFICALIPCKNLPIAPAPFRGEYFHGDDDGAECRSLAQNQLIAWCFVSVVALIAGTNHNNHIFFAGIIPCAMLFGIALASSRFWYSIRQSIEARIVYILIAWACMGLAFYQLYGEPFRLVRYLLTDPLMHWAREAGTIDGWTIFYILMFIILSVVSVSGIVEVIQTRITQYLKKRQPVTEQPSYSSGVFYRLTRDVIEPMPYAAVVSLLLLAAISALNIYFAYVPKVSDAFTETALIERYFALADESEPIYLLSGENDQFCVSYRDCDPGYVCQNSHCQISTFASYSLNVAHPISRDEMIRAVDPAIQSPNAFYVVPKDAIYGLNQSYRRMFDTEERRNLNVIDAPSSRLYLIANHEEPTHVNPLDSVILASLPEDASPVTVPLGDNLSIEGFRIDSLDFTYSNTLNMTLFYRVREQLDGEHLHIDLELSGRKRSFTRALLSGRYDDRQLLPGDLIADSMRFEVHMMPNHGSLDVNLSSDASSDDKHLTTINF